MREPMNYYHPRHWGLIKQLITYPTKNGVKSLHRKKNYDWVFGADVFCAYSYCTKSMRGMVDINTSVSVQLSLQDLSTNCELNSFYKSLLYSLSNNVRLATFRKYRQLKSRASTLPKSKVGPNQVTGPSLRCWV